MVNKNVKSGGLSLSTVLFVVFLILKLTHVIDWSWWLVTLPLWIPIAIALLIGIIGLIVIAIITIFIT